MLRRNIDCPYPARPLNHRAARTVRTAPPWAWTSSPPARNPPDEINVIIEIPKNAEPVKYEVDKASGAIFVDRILSTPMRYPCNYGYVPHTLCGDGDPADVLVILPLPLIPGSVIRCRPVGVLKMTDEAGDDEKILAVPVDKVFAGYSHIDDIGEVPQHWLERIGHFFEHYKDLEKGKWVKLDGWGGADDAKRDPGRVDERYDGTPARTSRTSDRRQPTRQARRVRGASSPVDRSPRVGQRDGEHHRAQHAHEHGCR